MPPQPHEPGDPVELILWHGMTIVVQYGPGEVRHAHAPWRRSVPDDWRGYGEIAHVPVADGDDLDVVLGRGDLDGPAWVVWQLNPYRARAPHRARAWARQPKLFLGFADEAAAESAFAAMWSGHRSAEPAQQFATGQDAATWAQSLAKRG